MMRLKCENCKKNFDLGITGQGGSFKFRGGISAECPRCGHINRTPGGEVQFDQNGEVIRAYILDNDIPANDLLKFLDLAKTYREDNNSDEESFNNAAAEINPQLSGLVNLVKPKTPGDFYALLAVLIPLLLWLLDHRNPSPSVVNNYNTTINITYSNSLEEKLRHQRLEKLANKSDHKKGKK